MPLFRFHLHRRALIEHDEDGVELPDLHHAHLEVLRAIPDIARDLLAAGDDPMACVYVISDDKGHCLMEVPFTEVLSPAQRQMREARYRSP